MFRVASWSTISMIASGSDEIFDTNSFIFDIMITTVQNSYRPSLAHMRLDPNAMDRSSPVQKIADQSHVLRRLVSLHHRLYDFKVL